MKNTMKPMLGFAAAVGIMAAACGNLPSGVKPTLLDETETIINNSTVQKTDEPASSATAWETTPPELFDGIRSQEELLEVANRAERIQFEPGTTFYYSRNRDIGANTSETFVLRLLAGDELWLDHPVPFNYTDYDNFSIWLYGVGDGRLLTRGGESFDVDRLIIPATQDYLIVVINQGEATSYSLQVRVPKKVILEEEVSGVAVDGVLIEGGANTYLIYVEAGQPFRVSVSSSDDSAVLTVVGETDGTPYCRSLFLPTECPVIGQISQNYIIMIEAKVTVLSTPFPENNIPYTVSITLGE